MLKHMSNFADDYNITSNIKNFVHQLIFMIKCLNGSVIKQKDKINHLGHVINHGDDTSLSI